MSTPIKLMSIPAEKYFLARVKATGKIHKFVSFGSAPATSCYLYFPNDYRNYEIFDEHQLTITRRL